MKMISGLVDALERVRGGLGVKSRPALESAARELLAEHRAMMSLQQGETVEDFELPDSGDKPVRLSQLLRSGPVVLTFYRGGWCGYCSAYLADLQQALPAFRAAGAELVAISPQTFAFTAYTAEKLDINYPVLSDRDNTIARHFGLVYRLPEAFREAYDALDVHLPEINGTASFELPVPATYIVRPDMTIAYASVDADYTRRPDPDEILSHLQTSAAAARVSAPASS
jgi:peroxiredoxin